MIHHRKLFLGLCYSLFWTMRDIQELIENVEKYKTVLLQKRFDSKKNTVAYVVSNGQPRVLKWFVPGLRQNMDIEYTVLTKGSSDVPMPSPFEKDTENHVLVMSYIIGNNICDVINDPSINLDEKQKVVAILADWFVRFHRFFKTEDGFRVRGDATLRNFILSKNQVWGVDFEESRSGKPGEDVATLCVSLLSTDPMFTDEKFELCQHFLDTYRRSATWNIENINAEISYAMLERIQWRPKDEEILRNYAMKIRTRGLQAALYTIKHIRT
jgi:tRNA A-37 threonylcarbamoyl transferase component Bud32